MNKKKHKVWINFKSGSHIASEIGSYKEFSKIAEALGRYWCTWLYVGAKLCVRKKEVESIYYELEEDPIGEVQVSGIQDSKGGISEDRPSAGIQVHQGIRVDQ